MPVGISGLATDFDSQELIAKLIEVESRPIKRMQDDKELMNLKIEVLQELNRRLNNLENSAHNLYGIDSVFKNKVALNTDESAFSVLPGPNSLPGNVKMEISQIAAGHVVSSDPLPLGTILPKGIFHVSVGSSSKKCEFEGGSIEDLAYAVNRFAGDLVKAAAVRDTEDTVVLTLASVETGKDARLNVSDPDGILASLKLMTPRKNESFRMDLSDTDPSGLSPYSGKRADLAGLKGTVVLDEGLVLHQCAREIVVDETGLDSSLVLEVSYSFRTNVGAPAEATVSDNIIWSRIDPVQVRELTIRGAPFAVNPDQDDSAEVQAQDTGTRRESGAGVALVKAGKRTESIFTLQESSVTNKPSAMRFSLDNAGKAVNRIILFSNDPSRDLVLTGIRIVSTRKAENDFARTIQEPRNARFKINDIDVERSRNDGLKDVLRDVSISLKAPTRSPVTFTIDHDMKSINRDTSSFVSNYNQTISFIDDIQKTSKSDKPGEYKLEDRGAFAGDMILANIRSKLRAMVMSPYPTSLSNRLCLAMQAGISTGEWKSSFDDIRQGLLKYDENKFNTVFRQYPKALAELFGSDTDADLKPDNGLGFQMYQFLMGVTRAKSGVIETKIERTKEEIRSKDKEIASKKESVDGYENNLKQKFTEMEKNMAGLKSKQKWLEQQTQQKKQE